MRTALTRPPEPKLSRATDRRHEAGSIIVDPQPNAAATLKPPSRQHGHRRWREDAARNLAGTFAGNASSLLPKTYAFIELMKTRRKDPERELGRRDIKGTMVARTADRHPAHRPDGIRRGKET